MKLLRAVLIKNCLVHYSKNKFDFDEHVTSLCRKASQKLNALARVAYYMNLAQGMFIMNAFIFSQFGYCPLVWMFYSRKLNNRIKNIHECSKFIEITSQPFSNCWSKINLYLYIKETCKYLLLRFLRQKWFKPSNHRRCSQVQEFKV